MKKKIAEAIGTAFGAGYAPIGPGTMGTLVTIPLVILTFSWSLPIRIGFWLLLTFIGTWAAKTINETENSTDHPKIVIDEVVGYGLTTLSCTQTDSWLLVGFVVFRILDIYKPPPIRQIDLWSKKMATHRSSKSGAAWWNGFGVVADDALAGIIGLIFIILLKRP